MREARVLVLASNNKDKLLELRSLFEEIPQLELVPAEELIRNSAKIGTVEIHSTYQENAIEKARLCNKASHYPCLADDSGMEVLGLEGKPGIRSARYAIPKAGMTQSQANIEKILSEMKGRPDADWEARFVCTLALCMEGVLITGTGELKGRIVPQPRGDQGFGYDPIFVPEGMDRTLAQMKLSEKNRISHRSKAFHDLLNQIMSKGLLFAKP